MLNTGIVIPTLFASLASAAPSLVARTCSPSFTTDQSIYALPPITDFVYELTPNSYTLGAHVTLQMRSAREAFHQGEFSILTQNNGLYVFIPAYSARIPVALTAGHDGNLAFGFAGTLSIPTQQFNITCDECSESQATKCTIQYPNTSQCVTGSNDGDILSLGSCDEAGVYYFTPTGSA